jgi:hypothetical protein
LLLVTEFSSVNRSRDLLDREENNYSLFSTRLRRIGEIPAHIKRLENTR